MNKRRSIAACTAVTLATIGLSIGPAYAKPDPNPQLLHNISCQWSTTQGTPVKSTTSVVGKVGVNCSDNLDDANTQAQLQIESGSYTNFGNPVTSYSTSTTIRVTDTAPGRSGFHYYRVQGTHFGQHGNIFSLPTYYSEERGLSF